MIEVAGREYRSDRLTTIKVGRGDEVIVELEGFDDDGNLQSLALLGDDGEVLVNDDCSPEDSFSCKLELSIDAPDRSGKILSFNAVAFDSTGASSDAVNLQIETKKAASGSSGGGSSSSSPPPTATAIPVPTPSPAIQVEFPGGVVADTFSVGEQVEITFALYSDSLSVAGFALNAQIDDPSIAEFVAVEIGDLQLTDLEKWVLTDSALQQLP